MDENFKNHTMYKALREVELDFERIQKEEDKHKREQETKKGQLLCE